VDEIGTSNKCAIGEKRLCMLTELDPMRATRREPTYRACVKASSAICKNLELERRKRIDARRRRVAVRATPTREQAHR